MTLEYTQFGRQSEFRTYELITFVTS